MARKKQLFGASKIRKKLLRMPEEIQAQVRGAVKRGSEEVLFEMQKRAPVSMDPVPYGVDGLPRLHLRSQLEAKIAKNGLSARVGLLGTRVANVFFFWRFLEFGTKKMDARPFAFPAWRAVRDKIRRDIRNSTVCGFRTVARSNPSDG